MEERVVGQLKREYRTPRLLLRPFTEADVDAVFRYAVQPEYRRFLDLPDPYERKHAEAFIASCLDADWAKHSTFALNLGGEISGGLSFDTADTNWSNLGYAIDRTHWGKGLVVEAAKPLISDMFSICRVARIEISAAAPNRQPCRVAEKLGFRHEGTLRSRMVVRDQRYDCAYYGLLPHEWQG